MLVCVRPGDHEHGDTRRIGDCGLVEELQATQFFQAVEDRADAGRRGGNLGAVEEFYIFSKIDLADSSKSLIINKLIFWRDSCLQLSPKLNQAIQLDQRARRHEMTELDMELDRVLSEHKSRRRVFLAKMVLAPAALSSTGLLVNMMAVGKAWAVPITTQVTFPATTVVTFPVTTLFTQPVPVTTLFTQPVPVTTLFTQPVTLPFTTLFTLPISFSTTNFTVPVSNPTQAVPEPSSALLVSAGIVAAIAISSRYRAAAETRQVAAVDLESPDQLGE